MSKDKRTPSSIPDELIDSLLRLVGAVAIGISEEWETGRIYLSMDAE